MDRLLRWKTDRNLYGPSRISGKTDIKDLLLRDHVLQKGEWYSDTSRLNPWKTTFSHCFKTPLPACHDPRKRWLPSGRQNVTAFVLGSSSDAKLATTCKDFDRKWLKTPLKVQPDLGTSIPDFAPKYMSNKYFGKDGSIYKNAYDEVKRADTSQNTKERKQYTKDLRTTHFQLGTSNNAYDSETTHRFSTSDAVSDISPSFSAQAASETHRSSVFRDGDWNVTGKPSVTHSVTRNDFHIKPFAARGYNLVLPRLTKTQEGSPVKSFGEEIQKEILQKHFSQSDPTSINVRQAFVEYDTDRSGFITKEELKKVIGKYRPSITDIELEALITECNPGRLDNKLEYALFARYLESFSRPPAAEDSFTSIQQERTHFNKTSPKDNPHHPYYHVSTHFELGNDEENPKSLYYKDFMMGNRDPRSKPTPATPPMSSQVLPDVLDPSEDKSTNKADFVDHSDLGRIIAKVRDREAKRNQNRLAKQSVVIACDPRTGEGHRQASVSGADYPSPPKEFPTLSPRRAPQSRYRYLDTDGVLLQPPVGPFRSEIQDQFAPLPDQLSAVVTAKLKEKNSECLDRINDNRSSHFALGTDTEPKGSEQHHQFAKKVPLDPSVLAAGKKETPSQNYSHVYPSESADSGAAKSDAPKDEAAIIQERLKEMNKMRHSIPRDPVNTDVRRAFLEFDPCLSGKISKGNLRKACEKLGVDLPLEKFEMVYDACSKGKLGFIDYNQFMKQFTSESALVRGTKPSMSSVMKTDYCSPEQRSFTSAQQRTIDIARAKPLVAMNSHYFHLDHVKDGEKLTTTSHDFSRPDRLPNRQPLTIN